jgi:hypothetical protein
MAKGVRKRQDATSGVYCSELETPLRWEILQTLTCSIDQSQLKGRVVTTCQHIYALNYIHLFEQFGITDLFFPHKLDSHELVNDMRVHPFPLFPVQASPPGFEVKEDREYLASFAGAYNSNVYLTDVREHIFRLEGKDPLIKIISNHSGGGAAHRELRPC